MAVWLLRRAGIVLIFFFKISYCEYDLLENLKPKRDDPPELTDFLRSVLHRKDDFKKIREVAKHLQVHMSPVDEDVFLNDIDEAHKKPRLTSFKHKNIKHYRTNNLIPHPLSRRSDVLDRPINDVYPYMYDENEVEQDEREERSPWKNIKEKKHKHHKNRFRRGLDLTDYSSDNDLGRGNIQIFPRSRTGYRIVPGNRYPQRRDVSKRKGKFLQDTDSNSNILLSTEREIPEDFTAEHDILGFKAESESEDKKVHKNKKNSELEETETNVDPNKLFDLNDETKSQIGVERKKRSMKLNIIDDNNLITNIAQDNAAKTVILTLRKDKSVESKEDIQRKTIPTLNPDFESLHKALHIGGAFTKMHENPSNSIELPKGQELQPDIIIQANKQNEKQDEKVNQDLIKQNESNSAPLIYQVEEDAGIAKENQDQKQNMLQDMDEPTSAIEQYELSTKPYIMGLPKPEDIFSSLDLLKVDATDPTANKGSQFSVKENKDMVHGNNKKSMILKNKQNEKIPKFKKNKQSIDYDQGEDLSELDQENPKRDAKNPNLEYTNDYYYQDQHESNFQGRKLMFYESERNQEEENEENSQGTRYGYLDYENGRNRRMRKPGYIENKIRVKRDLTDLFGMTNDEDYSEDLLDDYNPSVKQERSDYSYEEEGDSGVPEKLVYVKKKKNKEMLNKNEEEEKDLESSAITSEEPTSCGSSKNLTSKIIERKPKQKVHSKNNYFHKAHMNVELGSEQAKGKRNNRREVESNSCKNHDKPKAKTDKCDNCKPGNDDDENCKNCPKNGQKQTNQDPEKSSNNEDPWKTLESPYMKKMNIRSNNQTNSTLPGDACNTNKNATFHPKTKSNNTSSEENKKPPKEQANADQEFKFETTKNKTNPCDNINSTSSNNTSIIPNPKENNGQPLREQKNMYGEGEPEEETDFRESAGYAHHPLKNKPAPTINDSKNVCNDCSPDSKANVDEVLTRFHTKHNQNEFLENNQKPVREEPPDLETNAGRNEEEMFGGNHNQARNNKNTQDEINGQEVNENEKEENKFKRETRLKKHKKRNKKQRYGLFNKRRNSKVKGHHKNQLLNSVENFANIIEEDQNKKINKRNTNKQNQWEDKIKEDNGFLRKYQRNPYENDAPFEKFSKLNQGYWKNSLRRSIRHPNFYQNFNQNSNYPNKRYMNKFRRIRRDGFSKNPEKEIEDEDLENSEREESIRKFPNLIERKIRNKGQCNEAKEKHDKHKGGVKEWMNPQKPKSNKPCLLGKDTGLNPSFGLKPSKGSCNDEAELERGSKDYGQLHDALNGHLASLVVQTTFKRIKEHPQLKNRFSHGLARQHGFKSEMKDLNAFRNKETEGDVKHTEEMLRQIMTVLNKIILDQVRRRTCKHLPPELQKYLASITKIKKVRVDEDAKISEEGFPLPLVKEGKTKEKPLIDTEQGTFLFNNPENKPELETSEEEIKKKMKMIKELLNKYKHMSTQCKIKVEPVEEYLRKHLCLLKKILKEIKKQRAEEAAGKSEQFNSPNKLKRKNYEDPVEINQKQPEPDFARYNKYIQTDLINKQLNSIGLGPSRTYKPTFNLNKLIQDTKYKIKYKNQQEHNNKATVNNNKNHGTKTKTNYRNQEVEELQEDYENPKNEHKREIVEEENKRKLVSEKYKKLAQAVESFRKKREIEERLGKLFGKSEKRSIRNENYETIKSLNKQYQDYSRIGFETPMVYSLKK